MPNAIITGGGSGIGRAFCEQLAREGYEVAVVDRNLMAAEETVALIAVRSGKSFAVAADVSQLDDWRRLHDTLRSRWSRLDLLVNNAGILLGGELIACDLDACRKLIDVNLFGVLAGCHTFTPWLIESHHKSTECSGIINIGSIFGVISPPAFASYSAAKAGVISLSEALRAELGPHGLTVTVAIPGATPTQLFATGQYASPELATAVKRYLPHTEITAQQVAAQTLASFRGGKLYAPIGRRSKLFWRLKRYWPIWTLRLVARKTLETLGGGANASKSNKRE